MVSHLRRRWVCTLMDHLKFHFKPTLFKKKSVGKGIGIQGKSQSDKKLQHSFIWALGCGDLTLGHSGSHTILIACNPPGSPRGNCLWSPGVQVGHTFSSWNNSFLHTPLTKFISYYLKLKFFQHLSPPSILVYEFIFSRFFLITKKCN